MIDLIQRLRQHASAHEYIADQDDEQRQWMDDLLSAANEIERLRGVLETRENAIWSLKQELRDITIALDDERINNTMTAAAGARELKSELDVLKPQEPVAWMRTLSADLPHISSVPTNEEADGRNLYFEGQHGAEEPADTAARLRLVQERDRALDRIAKMAAELDTPYAWHHLHHGLRYERGDDDGWYPLYMIAKPEDLC